MTPDALTDYLRQAFPHDPDCAALTVDSLEPLTLILRFDKAHMRPGGTLSGPTLMKLVDSAMYLAVIAHYGESGKDAVTANLNVHFLARPKPDDAIARCDLVRCGKTQAVGTVEIEVDKICVAVATVSYSVPKIG